MHSGLEDQETVDECHLPSGYSFKCHIACA